MSKKIYAALFSLLFSTLSFSQSSQDCSVMLSATVQNSPAQITIGWPTNGTSTQYTIFRKLKSATTWGVALSTVSGTTTSYLDNTVSTGISYEYKVQRTGSTYTGYGYLNSGIEVPAIESRGKLILMVDSTFNVSLATELKRLEDDLEGDGWTVIRHDVLRTGSVTHVKSIVVNDYNNDPVNTKAMFIFGHVPVPYSGNLNPDGHPDHLGAWPTDAYYADVNGSWTDVSVNSTTASPARTQNVPGDGKFDQSVIPSQTELQVGRVDLANMTSFTLTETQLMKNYLDKDHDYRKKIFTVEKKGVVDDNFGYMSGEAFAASGYGNLSAMVGNTNVVTADYFASMGTATTSYQWSYGTGGGTYVSAGGIGNTTNFAAANLQGVFTMLFGSYFGDWDITNNFLRAPLAQGKILTNVWSGRPHWYFHHMGLGENIGYATTLIQNYQSALYYPNIYGIHGGWIHNGGLMGDPTLRNDIVAPVSNVVAQKNGFNCDVSWSASTQTNVLGYNIYRKDPVNTDYTKINSSLITGTTYTDVCLLTGGINKYMVRALVLENVPSGTYYNMSEGIADTAMNANPPLPVTAQFLALSNSNTITCNNTSTNATNYLWDFGNGATSTATNPVYTYTANGTYTITLIASSTCLGDTSDFVIQINSVGVKELLLTNSDIDLYPNPTNNEFTLSGMVYSSCSMNIYNSEGKLVHSVKEIKSRLKVDVSTFRRGLYLVKITDENNRSAVKKLIID
ncbi:MAG: hypothetical protein K0S32_3637 [Bacteroidetes bacterium]|nr:hypothetical protein [Bacteroidota bacterium]